MRTRIGGFTAVAAAAAAIAVPTVTGQPAGEPAAPTRTTESVPAAWQLPDPLIVGHRGASGYLPEHTLASYALAIELGADCIEPDLVSTSDGALIVRHEPNLTGTTDVAEHPEFADRETTKLVDGVEQSGWFASDFTLAEIRTLRAVQPMAERFDGVDDEFRIPTFRKVIDLAQRKGRQEGRTICVYPETKHPTFHQELGLPLEDNLVRALDRAGLNKAGSPVFIQSFEQSNLEYLNSVTPVELVQLIDANDLNVDGTLNFTAPYDRPYDWTVEGRADLYSYLVTPEGLAEVATYADGIGPWKPYLIPSAGTDANNDGAADDVNGDGVVDDRDRTLLPPTEVVDDAHDAGLLVTPYTFRDEQGRLASDYAGEAAAEYRTFFDLGVDGVFSDFASTAFAARTQFLLDRDPSLLDCLIGTTVDQERCGTIAPRT